MARLMHSSLSFSLHSVILTIVLIFIPTLVHSLTLESDVQALMAFRQSVDPNSILTHSYLSSWGFTTDPCESSGGEFLGILCTIPLDNSSSRITEIDLDVVGYEGFLPPSIENLTELTTLALSKNNFRGPIPETISNLKKLTRISFSENFFTGQIPTGIKDLKYLEFIDMSYNRLSGSIPAKISGLRSLAHLDLSHNGFSGMIPDLSGLWQLKTLDLGTNQLYGNLTGFPVSLRTLSLCHNALSGHISFISRLENLKLLDLSDNRFSGSISEEILVLPKVIRVNVSDNHFTELEVIGLTRRETRLLVLDARGNSLHGHLPVNLVALQNLTSINLSHNQFSGAIPIEYGAKLGRRWRTLFLDNNFLAGNLPPQFNSRVTIRGSLANNCLKCPTNIPLCRGGQRPATACVGQNNGSE